MILRIYLPTRFHIRLHLVLLHRYYTLYHRLKNRNTTSATVIDFNTRLGIFKAVLGRFFTFIDMISSKHEYSSELKRITCELSRRSSKSPRLWTSIVDIRLNCVKIRQTFSVSSRRILVQDFAEQLRYRGLLGQEAH